MPATDSMRFSTPHIAAEMKKTFGAQTSSVTIPLKDREVVEKFLRDFNHAHEEAGRSQIKFKR